MSPMTVTGPASLCASVFSTCWGHGDTAEVPTGAKDGRRPRLACSSGDGGQGTGGPTGPLTGQVTHALRVEHMQGLRGGGGRSGSPDLRGLPGATPAGLHASATAWSAALGTCRGCLLVPCHVADGHGLVPTSQRPLTQELPLSMSPLLTCSLHRTTASFLHLGSCCHSGPGHSPGWVESSWFPRQNRTPSTNAARSHMPARPPGSVFSWPRGLCWPSPSGLAGHGGLHQASVCPGADGPRAGAEAWGGGLWC